MSLLGLACAVVPRLHASVRMFFKYDAVGRDAASGIRKAAGEGRSAAFRAFACLDDAPGDFDQRGVKRDFLVGIDGHSQGAGNGNGLGVGIALDKRFRWYAEETADVKAVTHVKTAEAPGDFGLRLPGLQRRAVFLCEHGKPHIPRLGSMTTAAVPHWSRKNGSFGMLTGGSALPSDPR